MNVSVEMVHAGTIGRVIDYFTDLQKSNLLKHRLPEYKDVNANHALTMITTPSNYCMFVRDMDADERDRFIGEVTLNGFQGKACQVHFSIHPDYHGTKTTTDICKSVLPHLAGLRSPDGRFYVDTLVGPIAESNKLARRLIKQVGYKYLCTLPNGAYIAEYDRYEGITLNSFDLRTIRSN